MELLYFSIALAIYSAAAIAAVVYLNKAKPEKDCKALYLKEFLLLILSVIVFSLLFFNLAKSGLGDEDEYWHAVNAYEMAKNKTFVFNTFQYEPDYYNSKPPFALAVVSALFRLFGASVLCLKLPAAAAALLIFLIGVIYLIRKYGIEASLIYAGCFASMQTLFTYHGFRTGNLDGIYCLLFFLAMLALIKAAENEKYYLLYALFLSLCFLTKATHCVVLFLIGVLALLTGRKKISLRTFVLSAAAGIIPAGIWAIARFRIDGTAFFRAMLLETGDKSDNGFSLQLLRVLFGGEKPFLIMLFILAVYAFTILLNLRSAKKALSVIGKGFYSDRILFFWAFFPVLFYMVSGCTMVWYLYPAYPAFCLIAGIYGFRSYKNLKASHLHQVFLLLVSVLCILYGCYQLNTYRFAGTGGGYAQKFETVMKELKDSCGDKYTGSTVYIQDRSRYSDEELDGWHNEYIALSEIYCDFLCKDGGVEAFLNDPDSLLVFNPDLWDKYESQLSGYVILEDNGYTVFSHERYEDILK